LTKPGVSLSVAQQTVNWYLKGDERWVYIGEHRHLGIETSILY